MPPAPPQLVPAKKIMKQASPPSENKHKNLTHPAKMASWRPTGLPAYLLIYLFIVLTY